MTIQKIAAGGLISLLIFGGSSWAQDKPDAINVMGTSVHQAVSTEGNGGDITQAFQEQEGVGVTWITIENNPMHDRLFRELSLPETSIDVGFVLNARAIPVLANLLEPLDEYMANDPIEDWDDIFPSLSGGMVFDGKTYGIPFRHASSCLHYNERLFNEAGLQAPETVEKLIEAAYAVTNAETGVYGLVIEANEYPNIVDMARAWDGDFITADYRIAVTEPGMTQAITTLRKMYEDGVVPRSWATVGDSDVQTYLQSGRAAITLSSCGRNRLFNAEGTQEAGNIKTVALPISETLSSEYDVAPAKVEFWSMVIPRNSKNKDLAWRFIKNQVSKEGTRGAALNGNGPVRISTYELQELIDLLPYAGDERAVLLEGRVPLPAFDNARQAADIFVEEVQAAVLGMKSVEDALASVKTRVEPLLP